MGTTCCGLAFKNVDGHILTGDTEQNHSLNKGEQFDEWFEYSKLSGIM
jgi:hypothetical protein